MISNVEISAIGGSAMTARVTGHAEVGLLDDSVSQGAFGRVGNFRKFSEALPGCVDAAIAGASRSLDVKEHFEAMLPPPLYLIRRAARKVKFSRSAPPLAA